MLVTRPCPDTCVVLCTHKVNLPPSAFDPPVVLGYNAVNVVDLGIHRILYAVASGPA